MKRRDVLSALACAFALHAAGAYATDLLGVVETSLDRDATLAASRDAYRAATQAVPKARAGLLPTVQGGWGRAYNRIAMEGFPNTQYWQNGWTVSLTQPIFDWARWSAYRQADYVVARGRLEAASAMQEAILKSAQAYFDVLAADDELARANDYLRALDAYLVTMRRAKAAGEATLVDLSEGEASRAQAQLQWLDAQNQQHLARVALEKMTGEGAGALARLPTQAVAPALAPADVEPWVTQAQAQGYTVQIADVALQIAKFDTEKARAGHYPSANIQVTHTPAGAAGGYSRPTTTTTGMLYVTIPVFDGGEITANVNEAKALEDKARDQLEAATRDAGANARDGWLRVAAGRERVAALALVEKRNAAALDATRIGFGAGSRTSTDVLRATDTLYASRRDAIRARYDTVLALLRLLAQTASLDLNEIATINTQLFAADSAVRPDVGVNTNAQASAPTATPIAAPIAARSDQSPKIEIVVMPPIEAPRAPVPPTAPRTLTSADMLPAASASVSTYAPFTP